MTTEPTPTETVPTPPTPRMPGRSTRAARRALLTGATLVLAGAGAGIATAAPASAEIVHIQHLSLDSACKTPGRSGAVPNAYYLTVTLFGGSGDTTFTFDSLSIKGGPALTSISPKKVTVPAHQTVQTVTLVVQGAPNSQNGVGSLSTHVVGTGFTATNMVPVPRFTPTHDGSCPVPPPPAPSVA